MIRTRDELLANLNSIVGENTDDSVLSLMEDLTDTLTDYEAKTSDNTNWHDKYNELDTTWRNRYRDRFMNRSADDIPDDDEPSEPTRKMRTFEDLFKED